MSLITIAQHDYELREGLSNFPDGQHPFIEGVVGGQAVVIAFEAPPTDGSRPFWLLSMFNDVSDLAVSSRPCAARVEDADQAREWVMLMTALYAKAAAAVVE